MALRASRWRPLDSISGDEQIARKVLEDYEVVPQDTGTEWCWAVTAISIFNFYCGRKTPPFRTSVALCRDLVQPQVGRFTPCGPDCKKTKKCKERQGDLKKALKEYGYEAYEGDPDDPNDPNAKYFDPLAFSTDSVAAGRPIVLDREGNPITVKGEIEGGRPVGVRLSLADSGGRHYVVIIGWSVGVSKIEYVYIHNPWKNVNTPIPVPYAQLLEGYPDHGDSWGATILTKDGSDGPAVA
jgi:hypothetical protein